MAPARCSGALIFSPVCTFSLCLIAAMAWGGARRHACAHEPALALSPRAPLAAGRDSWGSERRLRSRGAWEGYPGRCASQGGSAPELVCPRRGATIAKTRIEKFSQKDGLDPSLRPGEASRGCAGRLRRINLVFLGPFLRFHVASETRPPEPHRSNRDDCAAPRTSASRTETPVTLRRPPATPKQLLPVALVLAVEQIKRR